MGAAFRPARIKARRDSGPRSEPTRGVASAIRPMLLEHLVVAGDVTPDQVRALAETHYGPIAPSDSIAPRQRPAEPPQLSERRLTLSDARVSEPYISRSYLAPERDPGDQETAAALTILAELLGGNGTTMSFAEAIANRARA